MKEVKGENLWKFRGSGDYFQLEVPRCDQNGVNSMSLQELGHVMMYNNLVPLVRCLKSWTKIKIQKAECLNAMWYILD